MPRRTPPPTPPVKAQILGFVRAGAYAHVAAEAAGVSRETLAVWLARGRGRKAREPYRSFVLHLDEALAHARARAEMETLKKVPLDWLRNGPGRETEASPGWTGPAKPAAARAGGENPLEAPEVVALLASLLAALADFPEARAALAARLPDPGA